MICYCTFMIKPVWHPRPLLLKYHTFFQFHVIFLRDMAAKLIYLLTLLKHWSSAPLKIFCFQLLTTVNLWERLKFKAFNVTIDLVTKARNCSVDTTDRVQTSTRFWERHIDSRNDKKKGEKWICWSNDAHLGLFLMASCSVRLSLWQGFIT